MAEIKNFPEFLDKDLERLAAQAKEKQKEIGSEKISQQEILKQSLKVIIPSPKTDEEKNGKIKAAPDVLPAYLTSEKIGENIRLEVRRLINLVFKDGLESALKEARRKQPFIEDAFHDALVDKLLPELRKRGLI